jgi:hypothetical protein
MQKREVKKALRLLGDRVERSETIGLDNGGHALTVYWVDGGQKIFYALDSVESFLEDRGWGGRREPGPGKKLGAPPKRGVAKVTMSVRVTPEVKACLDATGNASEAVESMVRRSKAFRSQ